jgi:uncharacterized protein (TIGR00369 family)
MGSSHDEHYRKLERMYAAAPVNAYFKPNLRIEKGRAELIMPVRREFFHAAGAVHGAVYFKALDDSAYFAANSLIEDVFVLTISFHVHFIRPLSEGSMRAVGTVIHHARRLILAESVVFDAKEREVARGTGSFMRSQTPLSPEIGYER